jgi:hypothetical protein
MLTEAVRGRQSDADRLKIGWNLLYKRFSKSNSKQDQKVVLKNILTALASRERGWIWTP